MKMSDLYDFVGSISQKHPKNHDFTPGFGPKSNLIYPNAPLILM